MIPFYGQRTLLLLSSTVFTCLSSSSSFFLFFPSVFPSSFFFFLFGWSPLEHRGNLCIRPYDSVRTFVRQGPHPYSNLDIGSNQEGFHTKIAMHRLLLLAMTLFKCSLSHDLKLKLSNIRVKIPLDTDQNWTLVTILTKTWVHWIHENSKLFLIYHSIPTFWMS